MDAEIHLLSDTGECLKYLCRTEAATKILPDDLQAWDEGGCLILAKALTRIIPAASIYAFVTSECIADHFVTWLPREGIFVDSEGGFNEHILGARLCGRKFLPYDSNFPYSIGEIDQNPTTIQQMVGFLSSSLYTPFVIVHDTAEWGYAMYTWKHGKYFLDGKSVREYDIPRVVLDCIKQHDNDHILLTLSDVCSSDDE
jgi:hypothetical protein